MSAPSPFAAAPAPLQRWLSIVGIGEDGIDGLGRGAQDLIQSAEIVFGGVRHLALAAPLIRGEAKPWPSPFSLAPAEVVALRGRRVCVLASGDPFFYGVGATLAGHVAADETWVVPAPSAFSLAAARMGWPLQEATVVSVHGRALDRIRPHLHPGAKLLALTSDAEGPAALAQLLTETGFGPSRMTVLEALGGPSERVRGAVARDFGVADIAALNTVAIEVAAELGARVLSFTPGLDDDLFEHDGQITKREIRALTLSSLAPRHGQLLWDVGAGSGSIGIEWLLAHGSLRAIAIEADEARAARAARNAAAFGVPHLDVRQARAPEALADLPAPDAIFVGGGGSGDGVLDTCLEALKPSGRLVANAVTLETESELIARHAARGGTLTRLALARADAVGGKTGWRSAMPVTQWSWEKT
ncbi:bifunctional cobalt-precorrin-7 (C(5))-methyltransferase/cobalt-precorrin-6B (C(15))-methyltransferase [Methyloceanibacter caenitepidi]|uniref:Cobalt-precorrin-6y C5-methyltransferase n=1 Tax=Methyloceanibacter caenitepidi TaxID=1384459 RepID=A0A0A8JYL7_9HYPH|nr:bifunctional cobalt-precorrin-7 (C(5))-methyltransferase/cobalt-precorrin-6B (C(15))-methyltransferase [Methyloceanibacter caenitepidi]BAQ15868.1 cobalt-precorrin-6y C5-methyltransferase [Methyloceanibacter caenitepidi]